MASVAMRVDLSRLIDATLAGDSGQIAAAARELVRDGAEVDGLIGRIGMIAAHGDSDGHTIITLTAACMLSRWLNSFAWPVGENEENRERALPLLVQALVAAGPAVRAGHHAQVSYPEPYFPSGLPEGKSVADLMHDAIYNNDAVLAERLLFGLYGTGADYRTMQVRAYDSISTTFQHVGHPLIFAVRGFQLLDSIEWGDQVPNILHWLTPHLPLHSEEPLWVQPVRNFLSDPAHSLAPLRTRIAAPRNEDALPLRRLLLSNAETPQVCQAVFDALMKGGASTRGLGSVIALAAVDVMQKVGDGDRAAFLQAAHGLLFSSAVRLALTQVQDIEAVPLLFTSAAFVNELQKDVSAQAATPKQAATSPAPVLGGGLIAPAILDTLSAQLDARDLEGAFSTARRYLQLGHDVKPLFATIGLSAAQADAAADQGHTLQIAQAAGEEFLAWPGELAHTNIDGFLLVALRAAAFAERNTLASQV